MSQTNNPADMQKKDTGKKMLLMLAAIFVLPFTIAATLHFLDIRPSGKSFGNLIQPPVSLDIPELAEVNGNAFSPVRWEKIWSVIMIDDANCAEACQSNIDKIKRVHVSLHKEIKRVQRVLILKGDVNQDAIAKLQVAFPDLIVLTGDAPSQLTYIANFTNAAPMGSVYLVDPLNNLMMHYPQAVSSKELRADLRRLLKNSWAG
ncbi:MAG: hypothetical protein ACKE5M_04265 [Methylophilaceae bacterium]